MKVTVPAVLIRESRSLLAHPPSSTHGLWERAAVLLARQALEEMLGQYWRAQRLSDLLKAPMRAQLLCLAKFTNDDFRAASDTYQLWAVLSQVCHFDACYLTPSEQEIHSWLDRTEELCEFLAHEAGRVAA